MYYYLWVRVNFFFFTEIDHSHRWWYNDNNIDYYLGVGSHHVFRMHTTLIIGYARHRKTAHTHCDTSTRAEKYSGTRYHYHYSYCVLICYAYDYSEVCVRTAQETNEQIDLVKRHVGDMAAAVYMVNQVIPSGSFRMQISRARDRRTVLRYGIVVIISANEVIP
jgi:hypothetical protein